MHVDVLIPAHKKDFHSLNICIEGIRANILNLNKIFIVSNENPKINGVIYISEERYNQYINIQKIISNFEVHNSNLVYRSGWIYQQFLKLLSAKVIPELIDSYVIVDCDTIFLRPIYFDPQKFYYCHANEYHLPYLPTIKQLLGLENTIGFSTICHHMIFCKKILNEMILNIEKRFNKSFFECVLETIDYNELSSISEWDLYSNYILNNYPYLCEKRQLIWEDISYIPSEEQLNKLKQNLDFVSCHSYLRTTW